MARICTEITEWIEEEISKPVEEWEERQGKKCKKRKWYDPRKWLCWFVTIFVKVIRWVIVTVVKAVVTIVCRFIAVVIYFIVDLLQALWLFAKALLLWDKCILQEAISELGNVLVHIYTAIGYIIINPFVYQINRYRLKNYVREQIEDIFSDRPDHIAALKDAFHIDHGTFGYRVTCTVRRMFVDSQANPKIPRFVNVPNLFGLHDGRFIDLYQLAGFTTPCELTTEKGWYRPRPQTAKFPFAAGGGVGEPTPPSLEKDELTQYINSNGAKGPHFRIYAMSTANLEKKLGVASEKGRQLGLILNFEKKDIQVFHEDFINYTVGVQSRFLKDELKRIEEPPPPGDATGAFRDLCNPVAVGVFGFTDRIKRGQATNLVGTTACKKNNLSDEDTSGVSFIDDIPDELRKYILIHELGHYYGLCHVDGFDRIMVSGESSQGDWFTWKAFPNTFFHGGPRFTLSEAKQAWDFILANFPEECFVPQVIIT
jgi:hypothetical protein